MRSAQGTIKVLINSGLSSELTPFLAIIGWDQPGIGGSTQNGDREGTRALSKRCKITPLVKFYNISIRRGSAKVCLIC